MDVGVTGNGGGGCGAGDFFLAFSIGLAAGDTFASSDAVPIAVGLIGVVGGNGAFRFPFTCTLTGILFNEV